MGANTVKLWAKIVGAIIIAGAGVAYAGDEMERWKLSPGWKFTCAMVPLAVALIGTVASAISQVKRVRLDKRRDDIKFTLSATGFEIQDITGIDSRNLGLAAYHVDKWGPWVWPWQERLERLVRVRPKQTGVSGVRWRPGVGIVGQCVEQGKDICEDLSVFDSQLQNVTRQQWESLPREDRMGLTYGEYLSVRGKFGAVLASPIIDRNGSGVLGCVSVDGPSMAFVHFSGQQVREALAAAADELAQHVFS
ncbi:hypothetical protein [Streptomyces sp. NPDC002287]